MNHQVSQLQQISTILKEYRQKSLYNPDLNGGLEAKLALGQIAVAMVRQLQSVKDPIDFLPEIQAGLVRAEVQPGEPIGSVVAGDLSQVTTQLTLNSIHANPGAIGSGRGYSYIMKILAGSHTTDITSTIIFRDRMTVEEIWRYRPKIVQTNFSKFISDYQVVDPPIEPWVEEFEELFDISVGSSELVLQITLNLNALYEYQVTPERLRQAILKADSDSSKMIQAVIYSPYFSDDTEWKIQLYIYPLTDSLDQITTNSITNFLNSTVITVLKSLLITGISGIEQMEIRTLTLFPSNNPTTRMSQSSKLPIDLSDRKDRWKIVPDEQRFYHYGVSINDLMDLLDLVGYEPVYHPLVVVVDDHGLGDPNEVLPGTMFFHQSVLDAMMIESMGDYYQIRIDTRDLNDLYLNPRLGLHLLLLAGYTVLAIDDSYIEVSKDPSQLEDLLKEDPDASRLGYYNYVATWGYNLNGLVQLPEVSIQYTRTDSAFSIQKYFGIAALRGFIMDEMALTMKQANINLGPTVIETWASFLTHPGTYSGIMHSGLGHHDFGTVTSMVHQRTSEHLSKIAVASARETSRSVAGATATGEVATLGTGLSSVKSLAQRMRPKPAAKETMIPSGGPPNLIPRSTMQPVSQEPISVEVRDRGDGLDPVSGLVVAPAAEEILNKTTLVGQRISRRAPRAGPGLVKK